MKEWRPETGAKLPQFGPWLPPVWLTGLHQVLSGIGTRSSRARRADDFGSGGESQGRAEWMVAVERFVMACGRTFRESGRWRQSWAMFGGLWIWLRRRRRKGWGQAKLIYEDTPRVVTEPGD